MLLLPSSCEQFWIEVGWAKDKTHHFVSLCFVHFDTWEAAGHQLVHFVDRQEAKSFALWVDCAGKFWALGDFWLFNGFFCLFPVSYWAPVAWSFAMAVAGVGLPSWLSTAAVSMPTKSRPLSWRAPTQSSCWQPTHPDIHSSPRWELDWAVWVKDNLFQPNQSISYSSDNIRPLWPTVEPSYHCQNN